MQNRRHVLIGLTGALVSAPAALATPRDATRVMVVATMHKRHATSARYGYDDIYAAVARFWPDAVGVEIRAEDMSRPDDYLSKSYPVEMIHLARAYGPRAFGFDWLNGIEGRAIPDDWWKVQSPIKRLEREMNAGPTASDATHRRLAQRLSDLSDRQDKLLERASVTTLGDGRYDRVTADYYATLRRLTAGTRFAALPAAYAERDRAIARNVCAAIDARRGQRIAIVTGGDHHGPVVAAIRRHGYGAALVPVT